MAGILKSALVNFDCFFYKWKEGREMPQRPEFYSKYVFEVIFAVHIILQRIMVRGASITTEIYIICF